MTRAFLLQRGSCCRNGCLNCPYKEMEIIEKVIYNLEGEVTKRIYTVVTPGEFDYLRTFESYGEARQYIKDSYGI